MRTITCALTLILAAQTTAEPLRLNLRKQTEVAPDAGRYHTLTTPAEWDPARTAAVVCDMWDIHWCTASAKRVDELAPRMNALLKELRSRGVLIVHCPSDTMAFYEDTPQRRLARSAPKAELKVEPQRWCRLDPGREPPLPIDDSRGGCDTVPTPENEVVWTRQHPAIEIAEGDAITDSAEALHLMADRGIDHVLVMGVHTNFCVLGRPFGVRQLVYQGKTVALVRDMTDAMYDPNAEPKVSHFTGTDLVVSHVERHWCPTVTSADILGGDEFRFRDDTRPTVLMMIGEDEYRTEKTLPEFGLSDLGRDYRVGHVFASERDPRDFPGLEAIREADALVISVRRRTPPAEQLDLVREFINAGKPVVGVRTASHAFELRSGEPPAGHAVWKGFDREILGCDYSNHYPNSRRCVVVATDHPLARNLPREPVPVSPSLYRSNPLHPKAEVLLVGRLADGDEEEPVAWTFTRPDGGRTFYTSLGHVDDFKLGWFRAMMRDGLAWTIQE